MALRLRAVTSEASEFEAAKARWGAVRRERQELKARLDGAKAALVFAENPPSRGDFVSPVLASRAQAYLAGRQPNADRLRREILDLDDELAQTATRYSIEATSWRLALEAEAARRAEQVRPRHRAAVKRIAQLVEQLSLAVEAERAIRAELAEVGSSALPDASRELGSLNEFNSVLSSWNRRMLAEGALG
jgi:hypothetical protein